MPFSFHPHESCRCGSGRRYFDCCHQVTRLPRNAAPSLRRRFWGKYLDIAHFSLLEGINDFGLLEALRFKVAELLRLPEESLSHEPLLPLIDHFALYHLTVEDFRPSEDEDPVNSAEPVDEEELAMLVAPVFALKFLRPPSKKNPEWEALAKLIDSPFSWYRVVELSPRESLVLHDMILDKQVTVANEGTPYEKGAFLCGKVVTFEGISLLVGTHPDTLPPSHSRPSRSSPAT